MSIQSRAAQLRHYAPIPAHAACNHANNHGTSRSQAVASRHRQLMVAVCTAVRIQPLDMHC